MGSFSERHGYVPAPVDLRAENDLPIEVQARMGELAARRFVGDPRFTGDYSEVLADLITDVLEPSPETYQWKHELSQVQHSGRVTYLAGAFVGTDWRLVYDIVERVWRHFMDEGGYMVWDDGPDHEAFSHEVNELLEAYRIPWQLQTGRIISRIQIGQAAALLGEIERMGSDETPNDLARKALLALHGVNRDLKSANIDAVAALVAALQAKLNTKETSMKKLLAKAVAASDSPLFKSVGDHLKGVFLRLYGDANKIRHGETGIPAEYDSTMFIVHMCVALVLFVKHDSPAAAPNE